MKNRLLALGLGLAACSYDNTKVVPCTPPEEIEKGWMQYMVAGVLGESGLNNSLKKALKSGQRLDPKDINCLRTDDPDEPLDAHGNYNERKDEISLFGLKTNPDLNNKAYDSECRSMEKPLSDDYTRSWRSKISFERYCHAYVSSFDIYGMEGDRDEIWSVCWSISANNNCVGDDDVHGMYVHELLHKVTGLEHSRPLTRKRDKALRKGELKNAAEIQDDINEDYIYTQTDRWIDIYNVQQDRLVDELNAEAEVNLGSCGDIQDPDLEDVAMDLRIVAQSMLNLVCESQYGSTYDCSITPSSIAYELYYGFMNEGYAYGGEARRVCYYNVANEQWLESRVHFPPEIQDAVDVHFYEARPVPVEPDWSQRTLCAPDPEDESTWTAEHMLYACH